MHQGVIPPMHAVPRAATWVTICDHPKKLSVTMKPYYFFVEYGEIRLSHTYICHIRGHNPSHGSKYGAYWSDHPLMHGEH